MLSTDHNDSTSDESSSRRSSISSDPQGSDSSPPSPLSPLLPNSEKNINNPTISNNDSLLAEKKSSDSGWIDIPGIKKVSINGWLYNKLGIVAVRESKDRGGLITKDTFILGAGEFMYGDINDIEVNLKKEAQGKHPHHNIAPKTTLLSNKLQHFADSNDPKLEALRAARSFAIEKGLKKINLINPRPAEIPAGKSKSFNENKIDHGTNLSERISAWPVQNPSQIANGLQGQGTSLFSKRKQKKLKKTFQPLQTSDYNIPHIIQEYAEEKNTQIIYKKPNPSKGIFNPIAFLPFTLTQERENKEEEFGFKIYPWLSSGTVENFNPSGFTTYVIASCMFGSSIKGRDDIENSFAIIKHDIQFHTTQRIESIQCEDSSFYETAQLEIFKKIAPLMKKLGDEDYVEVYCHLPSIDYMLFGVRLYIENKMTEDALEDFFVEIMEKKKELTAHFKEIFEEYGINITIASPFDNLISEIKPDPSGKISREILTTLGLTSIDGDKNKNTQEEVVQHCLQLIMNNEINLKQAAVWKDFVKIAGGVEKIKTLEELFKYGNAVMLATAAKGKEPYKVCSIQPYSEMQIQRAFVKHSTQLNSSYAPICNLTYFDPILGYDINNKVERRGLAFYYSDVNKAVKNLNRFFNQGFKNAVCFPEKHGYLSLEKSHLLNNK